MAKAVDWKKKLEEMNASRSTPYPSVEAMIRSLFQQYSTQEEVAAALGITYVTAYNLRIRYGIPAKGHRERKKKQAEKSSPYCSKCGRRKSERNAEKPCYLCQDPVFKNYIPRDGGGPSVEEEYRACLPHGRSW